jgi:integrase
MPKMTARLTAKKVEATTAPGLYPDGAGLYLQVTGPAAKSWLYRYTLRGRQRWAGLGSALGGGLSLANARSRRDDMKAQVKRGDDPVEARRQEAVDRKLTETRSITFREAAFQCIAAMRPGWDNPKHANQWDSTLRTYAYPVIGALPVAVVDTQAVLKILQPIWSTKTETAKRLRGRIERVLDWATSAGFRTGENPARWRGHMDNLLAKPSKLRAVEHHAALPYGKIGGFMAELREREGIAALALEFAILTCTRTSEVLGATWDEIDTDAAMWTIPAARMKARAEHRVPLSPAALDVLRRVREITTHHDAVFPNLSRGRPLSNMATLKQLARMNRADLTVHGFRSTFRDWAAERTGFERDVVEKALAHTVGSKVEAAYQRGDLLEKRRRLMNAWADYCAKVPTEGGQKVVKFRA